MGIAADGEGRELILVGSWAGRGVFDSQSGECVARDTDDAVDRWMKDGHQLCEGVGPLANRMVRVAGLWGGGLIRVAEDGWSVAVIPVDWPEERVFLQPPGRDVMTEHLADGCVLIDVPLAEVRAAGFAPSGCSVLVATASDLAIFNR